MTLASQAGVDLHLVDSSAWIPYLRPPVGATPIRVRIATLLATGEVATTGMVRLEVLRGARDTQDFNNVRGMLNGLRQLHTDETLWEDAARLGYQLRRAGLVVQATDLVIAAVALHAGAVVLHRDRDFDLIAQHTPLRVESFI